MLHVGMADTVHIGIHDFVAHGHHGVLAAERELGQRFEVDINAELASCPGTESDAVEDTVDYARITSVIAEVIEGPSRALLERLASDIADRVLVDFRVRRVTVRIRKPAVPVPQVVSSTSVTLIRDRT